MASDPDLLQAYRRQLRWLDPSFVFMVWQGHAGIDPDDLLDEYKRREQEIAAETLGDLEAWRPTGLVPGETPPPPRPATPGVPPARR